MVSKISTQRELEQIRPLLLPSSEPWLLQLAMDCDELFPALLKYRELPREDSPMKRADYANPNFWDARFQGSEGLFDWYATYEELKDTFEEFCPTNQCSPVLVVGCGNSGFSSELREAGYLPITSIDISASAICKMQEQFNIPGMSWCLVPDGFAFYENFVYLFVGTRFLNVCA